MSTRYSYHHYSRADYYSIVCNYFMRMTYYLKNIVERLAGSWNRPWNHHEIHPVRDSSESDMPRPRRHVARRRLGNACDVDAWSLRIGMRSHSRCSLRGDLRRLDPLGGSSHLIVSGA